MYWVPELPDFETGIGKKNGRGAISMERPRRQLRSPHVYPDAAGHAKPSQMAVAHGTAPATPLDPSSGESAQTGQGRVQLRPPVHYSDAAGANQFGHAANTSLIGCAVPRGDHPVTRRRNEREHAAPIHHVGDGRPPFGGHYEGGMEVVQVRPMSRPVPPPHATTGLEWTPEWAHSAPTVVRQPSPQRFERPPVDPRHLGHAAGVSTRQLRTKNYYPHLGPDPNVEALNERSTPARRMYGRGSAALSHLHGGAESSFWGEQSGPRPLPPPPGDPPASTDVAAMRPAGLSAQEIANGAESRWAVAQQIGASPVRERRPPPRASSVAPVWTSPYRAKHAETGWSLADAGERGAESVPPGIPGMITEGVSPTPGYSWMPPTAIAAASMQRVQTGERVTDQSSREFFPQPKQRFENSALDSTRIQNASIDTTLPPATGVARPRSPVVYSAQPVRWAGQSSGLW